MSLYGIPQGTLLRRNRAVFCLHRKSFLNLYLNIPLRSSRFEPTPRSFPGPRLKLYPVCSVRENCWPLSLQLRRFRLLFSRSRNNNSNRAPQDQISQSSDSASLQGAAAPRVYWLQAKYCSRCKAGSRYRRHCSIRGGIR